MIALVLDIPIKLSTGSCEANFDLLWINIREVDDPHHRRTKMIELRLLKTLKALAETGNLSKAAKRVHLSQPAVSHQIKAIEDAYGMELFVRKTNPLELTAAGRRLVSLAYELLPRALLAERDLERIRQGHAGQLRIAVECHSCFDWLMPAMDTFREKWPDVELDLVSGFHADPVSLLTDRQAELVIVSSGGEREGVVLAPLFRYQVLGLMAQGHPLSARRYLRAEDFAGQTLITYPIPDARLDVVRDVLKPGGIDPERRHTQLTVAILQLVASRRGIAALPSWAVHPYLERDYVAARPIGASGLYSNLYAATPEALRGVHFLDEFVAITRQVSSATLRDIELLS
jgi:LysR family transcriptional regulator for metE and metH